MITNTSTATSTVTASNLAWTEPFVGTMGTTSDINSVHITDLEKKISDLMRKPEVSADTKTKLNINSDKIYVKNYEDGFFKNERFVISDIKDVKIVKNVVMVTFADNTTTKAVLNPEDKFNLEQGISICITKKLLGNDGSAIYNKLIKRVLKVKEQNDKAAEKVKKAKVEEKQRREIALARHKKKKAKKCKEQIEIHTEAYFRAMKRFKSMKTECKCKCHE